MGTRILTSSVRAKCIRIIDYLPRKSKSFASETGFFGAGNRIPNGLNHSFEPHCGQKFGTAPSAGATHPQLAHFLRCSGLLVPQLLQKAPSLERPQDGHIQLGAAVLNSVWVVTGFGSGFLVPQFLQNAPSLERPQDGHIQFGAAVVKPVLVCVVCAACTGCAGAYV